MKSSKISKDPKILRVTATSSSICSSSQISTNAPKLSSISCISMNNQNEEINDVYTSDKM